MTTEEKAKAYEMALEGARKELGVDRKEWEVVQHVLHNIFPGLAESEDERIRKEIIEYLQRYLPTDELLKEQEMVSWLEKQKDASNAIEAVERIDKYIDENLANAHDMKDSNPDKKYYRGWDDALGKMSGILQDVYSNEKQKEQKPAEWSEEDEKTLNCIINVLDRLGFEEYCKSSRDQDVEKELFYYKGIQVLNKLKHLRPSWKPSEEQN